MKAQDFRQLDIAELRERVQGLSRTVFETREAIRSGKEKNNAKLETLRHDLARAKTILQEKEGSTALTGSSK